MAYSFSEHIGNGSISTFTFTFIGPDNGFFREEDIKVEVDGVEKSFILSGPTQVTLDEAPADQAKIRIMRVPDDTAPYTDFQRGNAFGKTNINRSFQQQLYVAHRFMDGFKVNGYYEKQDLSLGSHKIKDLADGTDPKDAVNVDQVLALYGSNEQNKIDAEAAAAAAEVAKDSAEDSADAAAISATSASNSSTAAADSASTASTYSDAAEASADAAALSAANAAASESSVHADAVAATDAAAEAYQSKLDAAYSAAAASTNGGIAYTQAQLAEGHADDAEASAAAASASASTASTKAAEASDSADAAAASAIAAANSATDAEDAANSIELVNPDWNATSGYAEILNKPNVYSTPTEVLDAVKQVDGDTCGLAAQTAARWSTTRYLIPSGDFTGTSAAISGAASTMINYTMKEDKFVDHVVTNVSPVTPAGTNMLVTKNASTGKLDYISPGALYFQRDCIPSDDETVTTTDGSVHLKFSNKIKDPYSVTDNDTFTCLLSGLYTFSVVAAFTGVIYGSVTSVGLNMFAGGKVHRREYAIPYGITAARIHSLSLTINVFLTAGQTVEVFLEKWGGGSLTYLGNNRSSWSGYCVSFEF